MRRRVARRGNDRANRDDGASTEAPSQRRPGPRSASPSDGAFPCSCTCMGTSRPTMLTRHRGCSSCLSRWCWITAAASARPRSSDRRCSSPTASLHPPRGTGADGSASKCRNRVHFRRFRPARHRWIDRCLPGSRRRDTDEAQSDVQRRAVAVPQIASARGDAAPPGTDSAVVTSAATGRRRWDIAPVTIRPAADHMPQPDAADRAQALVPTPEHGRCVRVGPWIHSGSSET